MLRLLPARHKIFSAAIIFIASLADSTALSVTISPAVTESSKYEEAVVSEMSSRSFTEVQIRRLRALLISSDQSDQNTIFQRLETLQMRSDVKANTVRD